MRAQIHCDRDNNVEADRRKLTLDSPLSSSLPQRDNYKYPNSVPDSYDIGSLSIFPTLRTRNIENIQSDLHRAKHRSEKKRMRAYMLFRSGVSLCPFLAIIFLLAGTPPVVLAQGQVDNQQDVTTPAPVPPETTETGTLETIPTNANTDTVPTMTSTTAPPTIKQTQVPTLSPTISSQPTVADTDAPSSSPSVSFEPTTPSPTVQPTMAIPSLKETKFRQEFQVGNNREFTEDEMNLFQTIYQRYTLDFAPIPASEVGEKITTICTVDKQTFLFSARERQLKRQPQRLRRRHLEEEAEPIETNTLNVDYTMSYESKHYNVTQYPKLFQNWTTNNLDVVLNQMVFLNFDVVSVDIPKRIVVSTPSPTTSQTPSTTPTSAPTVTPRPSVTSTEPAIPVTLAPTVEETGFESLNIIIISVSVIIAVAIIAVGLFLFYRKRRSNREDKFGPNVSKRGQHRGSEIRNSMRWVEGSRGNPPNPSYGTSETKAYGSSYGRHSDVPSRLADAVSSPPGSLVSSQSLISRGNSMGGDSREEEDAAHTLVDEFDQYKDQNLEKMRAEIEDLPECDGMMSQAVAKALIDQDDETFISSSYWGGDIDISPPEIEASALGFVLDWLKRNGQVSDREKRAMMQEQLNKMTASVLHKVIGPDDATRTIHECAVLLGLKLASELSVTTILVAGMRKKATEADMRRTFSMFGDIAVAAVAPNERGFGIVRFKSNNAVKRVMGKFRKEEIVIEDVAVQLIVIKAGVNVGDAIDNGSAELI